MSKLTTHHKVLFKIAAEADAKQFRAKLNDAEADALDHIAKYHQKINWLELEVNMSKSKKEVLKQKLEQLNLADETSWEKSSNEFTATLEDKEIPKIKSDEWFKTIQDSVV
jgi:hypothetical protein